MVSPIFQKKSILIGFAIGLLYIMNKGIKSGLHLFRFIHVYTYVVF